MNMSRPKGINFDFTISIELICDAWEIIDSQNRYGFISNIVIHLGCGFDFIIKEIFYDKASITWYLNKAKQINFWNIRLFVTVDFCLFPNILLTKYGMKRVTPHYFFSKIHHKMYNLRKIAEKSSFKGKKMSFDLFW